MKTQITELENQVLNEIKIFTSEYFSSGTGNWAYVKELADVIEPKKLRGALSSLLQKGILCIEFIDVEGNCVEITENYYKETGNYAPSGSPEIEFTNIEVK